MKKFSWFDLWLILLFLFSVYLVLTRIFGHSATDLTITIGLFSFLGSIIFKLVFVVFNINREIGETRVEANNLKSVMINSFNNVRKDINEIKRLIKKR